MKKRLLSLLVCLSLALGLFPAATVWASDTYTDEENGVEFTYETVFEGGVPVSVTITDISLTSEAIAGEDGSVKLVIPETISGLPVTAIDSGFRLSAVFYSEKIGSLTIPSGMTEIPDGRTDSSEFWAEGTFSGTNIAAVTFAPGSKLRKIGVGAFYHTPLTSVVIPEGVTEIGASAFGENLSGYVDTLSSVTLGSRVRIIGKAAFSNRCSLKSVTLPDSVTEIGDDAFFGCGLSEVVIPSNVEEIGSGAFSTNSIRSLIIRPGSASLTIGEFAFSSNELYEGQTVTLPERVVQLGAGVFDNNNKYTPYAEGSSTLMIDQSAKGATYIIKNSSLILEDMGGETGSGTFQTEGGKSLANPWNMEATPVTVYYPADMTAATSPSFFAYIDYIGSFDGWNKAYIPTLIRSGSEESAEPDKPDKPETAYYSVTGTLPEGASAVVVSGARTADLTMDGRSFTAQAEAGIPVTVVVSMDGYADKAYRNREFTGDWDLGTIPLSDLTPLSETGSLHLTLTGAGAADANVAVLDSEGKLAASGSAVGGMFLAEGLAKGAYTVLAFAANPYFSSISGEADLAALGIDEAHYGKASARVEAVRTAACTIAVPALDVSALAGIVKQGDVILQRDRMVKDLEFTVRISYVMAAGHEADGLRLNVPDGVKLTYVASANQDYAVDPDITPTAADQRAATFYVGLKAAENGNYSFSASVVSGSAAVPLGSAEFRVDDLVLDITDEVVTQRTTPVTVYASPNTNVTLTVGTDMPKTVRTNALGVYRGTLELPANMVSGVSTSVFAEVGSGRDKKIVSRRLRFADTGATLADSYFVNAGRMYWTVENGINHGSNGFYYLATDEEKNKYWTFSAAIESANIAQDVTLTVYMQDGSSRSKPMTLVRLQTTNTGYRQEYVCEMYIEQAGNHIFPKDLIPDSYEVTYTVAGRELELDRDYVAYIQRQTRVEGQQRERIIDEAVEEAGAGKGDTDVLFHDEYVVSDEAWDDGLDLTPQQKEEMSESIAETEQAIRELLDAIGDALGAQKDWSEYDDWDDFLEDIGVEQEDNVPYDPAALADQGFDVSEPDGSDRSFAVRETTSKDGQTQMEYRDSTGVKVTVKPVADAVTQAGINYAAGKIDDLMTKGGRYAHLAEEITEGKDDLESKAINKLAKGARGGIAVGKGLLGCFQAKLNSDGYVQAVDDFVEMQGQISNLELWKHYYETHGYSDECLRLVEMELEEAQKLLDLLRQQKNHALLDTLVGAGFTVAGVITALHTGGSGMVVCSQLNTIYDTLSSGVNLGRGAMIVYRTMQYAKAVAARQQNCGGNGKKGSVDMGDALLDPSGIVYEAVESNPLEGVTAVVVNAASGEAWNASDYGQVNPQITDRSGFYSWDVPAGTWRVEFARSGYQDASTEALEVPPPRLNLRTAMTATAAPAVESISAYPDYVEIRFSQYMDTAVGELAVPEGYQARWADPTPVSDTDDTTYARVLHLIPTGGRAQVGDSVSVTLGGVKNYAGKPLGDFSAVLTVQTRPAEMELNYAGQIAVLVGEDPVPRVTARVLDADGAPMAGLTVEAVIAGEVYANLAASEAVTDGDGIAAFSLEGLLPGMTDAVFTVRGTGLKTEIPLRVSVETNQASRPTAKLGSTAISAGAPKENNVTVEAGTTLELFCETPGAKIYYTTNSACPCQDTANRKLYTGPITVREDSYFRISAYLEGMEYSERLNIRVTVTGEAGPGSDEPFRFDDVNNEKLWYFAAVYHCYERQYFKGVAENLFGPQGTMTRAMFATVLYRIAGRPAVTGKNVFTDVQEGKWYTDPIIWAAGKGIIEGYGDGRFGTDDPVTREQMVTLFWRYQGKPAGTADLSAYRDAEKIHAWAQDAFAWAVGAGVIRGKGDGILDPAGTATRAEVAQIVTNYDTNIG